MPVLIGELEKITGSPSSVTQVMVRAHETRITGSALTTDELVPIPVDRQGRFEVPLRPGKAVLVLVHGGRVGEGERFPMLVEEGLGTITSAIKLASDRFDDYELDELERAAADMLASLDKGLVAATRAEVAKEYAEKARDKAGEHRDDAEKAAGTAATDAVQKADEKLAGYVTAAGGSATLAGKDADRAETARQGAETIQQGLPDKIDQELETKLPGELDTRVPAELDKHLPGELDERVPPLVASSIADDRAVADAAAAAIEGAVDEAMPTKADKTYVDEINFYRGALTSSDDLNDLNERGVHTTQFVGTGNIPPGAGIGIVFHIPFGIGAVQIYYSWATLTYYMRRRTNATTWGAWTQFASMPDLTSALGPILERLRRLEDEPDLSSGMKLVPLSITAPGTTVSQTQSAGSVRWVRRWAHTPSRVRVHIMNRNPANQTNSAAVTITGASLGVGAEDGTITNRTNLFAGAEIPAGGGELVSDWLAFPGADGDALGMTIGYTGTTQQVLQGGGWVSPSSTAWTEDTTNGWDWSKTTPFYVWVEAEVPASAPVLVVNGDSISIGTATDNPVTDAWPAIYAHRRNALPVLFSQHGSTMTNWTPASARWSNLYPGMEVRPDAIITALGQNDLAVGGITVGTLKSRYREVRTAHSQQWPGVPVYIGNLTPSTKSSAVEVVRREFNAWLATLPEEERGYFDFGKAVGSADDEALASEYSADGLHPNTVGQRLMGEVVLAKPVTPQVATGRELKQISSVAPLVGIYHSGVGHPEGKVTAQIGATYVDTAATAGAIRWVKTTATGNAGWVVEYGDTGWRNINSLTTVRAEGDIHLIRIGNQVTMKFTRFAPTADLAQWGLILSVPTGYRPDTDDIRAIPVNNSAGATDTLWQNYRSGQLRMSNHQDATGVWNMSVSWITHDPWPSTLPGTPA